MKSPTSHPLIRKSGPAAARIVFLFILVLGMLQSIAQASSGFSPTGGRPFGDKSAWNSVIGRNPVLDPNSNTIVKALASGDHPGIADLYAFGIPIYGANARTPKYNITCLKPWGTCPLQAESPVPIPEGAKRSRGSDGKMEVINYRAGRAYEFWQYRNDYASTSWGGIVHDVYHGDGREGSATGSGVSQLAGLVRVADINNGVINHALVFSTNHCMTGATNFRYPAIKTDGKFSGPGAVMEGSRLQLDPSINVAAIPNITKGEKMVAKALQKYGAYVIDCGGANMAFIFEQPTPGQTDPYPGVGFTYDYFGMDHIPWERLRVLQAWNSYD